MSEYICYQFSGIKSSDDMDALSTLLFELDHTGLEEGEGYIKVYFEKNGSTPVPSYTTLENLILKFNVELQEELIPDVNWNADWESSFEPVLVSRWVGVRASFHPPFSDVEHDIVIDPKMSFGTGHHATTGQMLSLMRHIPFIGKKVLDLGSGTAVLAILAEKLGAKAIIAIDNDPWCSENAQENCLLNDCQQVEIILGDLSSANQQYDIILANINRNYLLEQMSELKRKLRDGGYLFISGFYEKEAKMLLDKALEHSLIANYHSEQDNWCALILQNKI